MRKTHQQELYSPVMNSIVCEQQLSAFSCAHYEITLILRSLTAGSMQPSVHALSIIGLLMGRWEKKYMHQNILKHLSVLNK